VDKNGTYIRKRERERVNARVDGIIGDAFSPDYQDDDERALCTELLFVLKIFILIKLDEYLGIWTHRLHNNLNLE